MVQTDLTSITPTIILAIVAFYGAVLSTINFFNERKKEVPQIVIEFYWAWEEEDYGGEVLYAVARNKGWKTITLDYLNIEEFIKPKHFWNFLNTQTDKEKYTTKARFKTISELPSGKSYEFVIDDETLMTEHRIIKTMDLIATFVDQIGNQYQSKPILANPDLSSDVQKRLIFERRN